MTHSLLAVDLGMGALKTYSATGAAQIISQVATNGATKTARMIGLKADVPPMHVAFGTQSFWVGPRAHDWGRPIEALDYDRLIGSPEIKALLYGTLSESQFPPKKPVHLIVGLPVEMFTTDNIAAVKKAFTGEHSWKANDVARKLNIERVAATSQATGAMFAYLLNADGTFNVAANTKATDELWVMSIGFNTVELQVSRDKKQIERFTAGKTVGVRRLLELANPGRLYSLGELDARLRAGTLDVDEAMDTWTREVKGFIDDKWGVSWQRAKRLIIVGGGAILLRDMLQKKFNGRAFIPDDPVHAIAHGLYKLALQQGL